MALDIEGKGKKSALEVIEATFKAKGIANIISNNLAYTEDDNHSTVKWCVNLKAIHDNLATITSFEPAAHKYMGPTFFINGAASIRHKPTVYENEFPRCVLHQVEDAGHYLWQDKSFSTT